MDIILKYFPGLSSEQIERFGRLDHLYREWNSLINVISRKDLDQLYLHHVLHSLAIAKVCSFGAGARVADVGCGGGFPSVPLAIMFPEAIFTAVDSIGKKITVVSNVCDSLGLRNIETINDRMENVPDRFDYVVSRAVTDMRTFAGWVWNKIEPGQCGSLPNGILSLKGGDLSEELAAAGRKYVLFDVDDYFDEEFFVGKKVVYIPRSHT